MDTILGLASKGDRDALACLRDTFIQEATSGQSPYSGEALWYQAELLARMTAEHGNPLDLAVLSPLLLVSALEAEKDGRAEVAEIYREQSYSLMWQVVSSGDTEGIAALVHVIERRADDGDPSATAMLEAIISKLTPTQAAAVQRRVEEENCE